MAYTIYFISDAFFLKTRITFYRIPSDICTIFSKNSQMNRIVEVHFQTEVFWVRLVKTSLQQFNSVQFNLQHLIYILCSLFIILHWDGKEKWFFEYKWKYVLKYQSDIVTWVFIFSRKNKYFKAMFLNSWVKTLFINYT